MAEGIQFNVSHKSGIQAESSAGLSSPEEGQDTFLLLMQLMFPTPDELPSQKMDVNQENEEISNQEETTSNEQSIPTSGEDDNTAQLALMLNWISYTANQGGEEQEPIQSNPVINTETQIETQVESETLAANTSATQVTLLTKSINEKGDDGLIENRLAKAILNEYKVPAPRISVDTSQLIKQGIELNNVDNQGILNADVDKATTLSHEPNKQALADQLIAELVVGKKGGTQVVTRDSGIVNSETGDLSSANQVAIAARVLATNSQTQTAQVTPKSFDLATSITHQDWSNQFSQQIVWLSQQQVKSAVIRLNPKEMGTLEINLKIDKNHAIIQMTTHHDSARDAIEQSLPRLREMMQEQGIKLDDVNVQTRQQQEQEQHNRSQSNPELTSLPMEQDLINGVSDEGQDTGRGRVSKGLVDYFA